MRVSELFKQSMLFICVLFLANSAAISETITGNVEKNEKYLKNKIVDAESQKAIPFATVKIPSQNFQTSTDKDGYFQLNANINGKTIMSVEKDGYKPFSVTINKDDFSKPIVIGIEKTQISDLYLERNVIHIGDNKFSQNSANSGEFQLHSIGPYFSKKFIIPETGTNENLYFVIGSVIGVDTLLARNLGQSNVSSAYASPAQIYFNGHKIGEIKYNSDNQQLLLPKSLIKQNAENEITISAGKNLFQQSYIDYDDIELANLHIEHKPALAKE